MDRRQSFYMIALVGVVLATACSTEDENKQKVPVQFQTGMRAATTRAAEHTTRDNMWNTGDLIAVSDVTEAGTPIVLSYKANAEGSSVPLVPSTTSQFYWNIGQTDMRFEAWYPYSATKPTIWTVATDQRSSNVSEDAYNNYDLLFAPAEQTASGNAVNLDFYHQMAHVVVNIAALPKPEDHGLSPSSITYEVIDVTLGGEENTSPGIGVTGTIAMGTTGDSAPSCNWTNVTSSGSTTPVYLRKMGAKFFECLLPPQSNNDTSIDLLVFYTNIRESPYHYRVSSYNFRAGYEYIYNISIERIGLSVTSSVLPWTFGSKRDVEASTNSFGMPGHTIGGWTGTDPVSETLIFGQ